MAGRISGSAILPGYPEPGVTADEIVGLVNKYGLGLKGYDGVTSKAYSKKELVYLANTIPYNGPSVGETSLYLEEWPVESNVIISVMASVYVPMLPHPWTTYLDNTSVSLVAEIGGAVSVVSGIAGQSVINGTDPVAWQGNYECFRVDSVPAGAGIDVFAKFSMSGAGMTYLVEGGPTPIDLFIKVMRVVK